MSETIASPEPIGSHEPCLAREGSGFEGVPRWLGTAILSIVVAFVFSVGTLAAMTALVKTEKYVTDALVYFAVYAVLFWVVFRGLDLAIPHLLRRRGEKSWWGPFGMDGSLVSFVRNWVVIFVCWLPYLVLPGVIIAWDTGDQIASYFGNPTFGFGPGVLFDHHPVFTTLLYGKLAKIGIECFGSVAPTLHALAYVQAIAGAGAIAIILRQLLSKVGDAWLSRGILLLLCLFPVVPSSFIVLVKDTLNLPFFLWWVAVFSRLSARRFSDPKPWEIVALVLLAFFCALTKKTSIYVIAATVVLALLLLRPGRRAFAATMATLLLPLVLQGVVWNGFVNLRYDVVGGESQAAFTPLLQMMARAAYENPNVLNDAEKQVFDDNLSGITWSQLQANYDPYTSDPCFWAGLRDGGAPSVKRFSVVEVGTLWAKLMRRAPGSMVRGYLTLESGWFSFVNPGAFGWPQVTAPACQQVFLLQWNTVSRPEVWNQIPSFKTLKVTDGGYFLKRACETLSQVPGISALCFVCVWTAILPAYLIRRLLAGRSVHRFAMVLPVLFSIAVLYLCPISTQFFRGSPSPTRYSASMVVLLLLVPALLAMNRERPAADPRPSLVGSCEKSSPLRKLSGAMSGRGRASSQRSRIEPHPREDDRRDS